MSKICFSSNFSYLRQEPNKYILGVFCVGSQSQLHAAELTFEQAPSRVRIDNAVTDDKQAIHVFGLGTVISIRDVEGPSDTNGVEKTILMKVVLLATCLVSGVSRHSRPLLQIDQQMRLVRHSQGCQADARMVDKLTCVRSLHFVRGCQTPLRGWRSNG